jgi:hypothetical protein
MTEHLLALSLAKPRWKIQSNFETYELFVNRGIHYITKSFFRNVLNLVTP